MVLPFFVFPRGAGKLELFFWSVDVATDRFRTTVTSIDREITQRIRMHGISHHYYTVPVL